MTSLKQNKIILKMNPDWHARIELGLPPLDWQIDDQIPAWDEYWNSPTLEELKSDFINYWSGVFTNFGQQLGKTEVLKNIAQEIVHVAHVHQQLQEIDDKLHGMHTVRSTKNSSYNLPARRTNSGPPVNLFEKRGKGFRAR